MHTACHYDEQTAGEHHGGRVNVFRGDDRGRPVAIRVMWLHLTDDLKTSLGVRLF